MPKFCPNCGNQMSDNANFCLKCGANLSDYSSGDSSISDSVIQRSQVGQASVGSVEVSPTMTQQAVSFQNACTECGAPSSGKCEGRWGGVPFGCGQYICGRHTIRLKGGTIRGAFCPSCAKENKKEHICGEF